MVQKGWCCFHSLNFLFSFIPTRTHTSTSVEKLHCSASVKRRQVDFEKTFCVFIWKMCKFPHRVNLLVQFCKFLNFLFLSSFQSTFFCEHSLLSLSRCCIPFNPCHHTCDFQLWCRTHYFLFCLLLNRVFWVDTLELCFTTDSASNCLITERTKVL